MSFAAGKPTRLLLVRHGATALTPEQRFSGSGGDDPALSTDGRWQAASTALRLAELGPVHAVVSSPLRRCRETAEAAAQQLELRVSLEVELREADFGAWDGLTFAEVRERYPDELAAWLAAPAAVPGGTGESLDAVTRRVEQARDKLLARYPGQTVAVVSHVAPLRTLVRLALGAPPESLFRMEISAASVSEVAYFDDGSATVRLLNDTSHLFEDPRI
ncbi:histidine phosphatase family protein [Nocardia sp. CDC153]|uniref:histidine phosphatase family protein n=1 Tax=Nocardia sp. CDC153 TaxID=3112167 RepID=UPI002DB999C0|nr:histidine phosphatase family protein [Nocardia sp. CDC153]MEC3951819.1 histidine phosphatase family protein [Nocardia sp. CDC153]